MPVTSLHGPYGIGVFGQEAMEFIDFLSNAGFHGWQILPIEQAGTCNSPYKGISAYAGEPMLIDPRMLLEMELVTEEDLHTRRSDVNDMFVDYEIVRERQWELLRTAFSHLSDAKLKAYAPEWMDDYMSAYESYLNFDPFWLEEYALYMAIYLHYDSKPWYDWPDAKLRSHNKAAVAEFAKNNRRELDFHKFVQWIFDLQWRKLKKYAKSQGITIIGDIPIYASENSADVWSRRELFDADADGRFAAIGGVPPDYFAPEGQLWGNPVYNWKLLEKENYRWWIDRLKAVLGRYDVVRLDHFRAFDSYWRVPGSSDTSKDGKWVKGPGMSFFKALRKELGDLTFSVIAEDLGIVDSSVEELVRESGFRGMRVLQFGFLGDPLHVPHNFPEETIAYTGTHDNTTLLAWIFALDPEDRKRALFYVGFDGDWYIGGPNCEVVKAWMRTLFMTSSSITIVPIQDLLGYGGDTRINIPGTPSGNWRFRIRSGVLDDIDSEYYRELHKTYEREDFVTEFAKKPEDESTHPEAPKVSRDLY